MKFSAAKMGCVSAKPDINDKHPNIFQVTNVNENRELKSPGQLEITESDLVLHQKGKTPLVWPLRTLRKYGYDFEIFTFECGRRCPTGQGIFAFQCKRAERLFALVQQNISRNVAVGGEELLPSSENNCQTNNNRRSQQQTSINQEGYLTPNVHNLRIYPIARPGSVSVVSGGPLSPPGTVSPPGGNNLTADVTTTTPTVTSEHNNNNNNNVKKRDSVISSSNCPFPFNTNVTDNNGHLDLEEPTTAMQEGPNYVNLNGETSASGKSDAYVTIQSTSDCSVVGHVYMNVDEQQQQTLVNNANKESVNVVETSTFLEPVVNGNGNSVLYHQKQQQPPQHCYVNLDIEDLQDRIRKARDNGEYENVDLDTIPELRFLTSGKYGNVDHLAQQLERIRTSGTAGNNVGETLSTAKNKQRGGEEDEDDEVVFDLTPKFNYAKLEFDAVKTKKNDGECDDGDNDDGAYKKDSQQQSRTILESPSSIARGQKESYATIDFYRTNALSQSVNPSIGVEEEGVRRTRHNSSIIVNSGGNNGEAVSMRTSCCLSNNCD